MRVFTLACVTHIDVLIICSGLVKLHKVGYVYRSCLQSIVGNRIAPMWRIGMLQGPYVD